MTGQGGAVAIPAVPVTVITGFLGSGKTTLINRFIRDPRIGRMAVIVNEFGEVGLDNLLIESASEDTVLLSSGCLCCAIQSDLADTLISLHARRASGELPRFERAVIETSGLADPAPILHTLMTHPDIVRRYYLDGIVTTVDVLHGEAQLAEHPESVKQAAMADRLVLTKSDLSDGVALRRLVAAVRSLNPAAPLDDPGATELDPSVVLATGLLDARTRQANVQRWLRDEAYQPAPGSASHHAAGIRSFCVYRDAPLSRAVLGMWLSETIQSHGSHLLRIKGIVNVAEAGGPLVVHGVQHRLYPPAALKDWPTPDRRTRVVFIVRDLAPEGVEDILRRAEGRCPEAGLNERLSGGMW